MTKTHQAAWRVLLPEAVDGPVAVADFDPVPTADLLLNYPDAVILSRREVTGDGLRRVVWDGTRCPLRPASVALLVVDDRRGGAGCLAGCVRRGGSTAAVVPSRRPHDFVLYPSPEELEWITAPGWPVMSSVSLRRRLARLRAVTPAWRVMSRAGLALSGAGASLVDGVLVGIGEATGSPARLRAVLVGRGKGQLTLRVGAAGSDIAVRLALTPRAVERLEAHHRAQDLLGRRDPARFSVPDMLAEGSTGGTRWLAESWLPGHSGPGGRRWSPEKGPGWDAIRAVSASLARVAPTGTARSGWAEGWVSSAAQAYPDHAAELLAALVPIEASGLETAWVHGDLWPGNVFLRRSAPPIVIDWDLARPDGPAGLDAVFAEMCRLMLLHRSSLGESAARMIEQAGTVQPGLAHVRVGGRMWTEWDAPVRRGLVVAALVRQASAGSTRAEGGDESWRRENLVPVTAVLRRTGTC